MNRDILESQWSQIRDILSEKFSNLTDEDIKQINGQYDRLVAKLQQKYGYSREEAEERIKNWNFDRFANVQRAQTARENKAFHEEKMRKDEGSSILPWLLALCLPLLLLAAYFYGPTGTTTTPTTTTVTEERIMIETPADHSISSNLRNALMSQGGMISELRNIQIVTNNGVVTLSGTVSNSQVRDFAGNLAQRFAGVKEVVNNIKVQSP